MRRCLIILAKEPQPGLVKTRVASSLGAALATDLYRCFLADTLSVARALGPDLRLQLSFWPPEAAAYFCALAPDASCVPQQGAGFDSRLQSAFCAAFAAGAERALLIGTDSPSLPLAYLVHAFALLDQPGVDVVLGPCTDGGWYLMGLRQPAPALFREISWSTGLVYQQTLARAAEAGLRLCPLPPWYDIDTAADLERLYFDLAAASQGARAPRTLALLQQLKLDGLLLLPGADYATGRADYPGPQ